MSFTPDRITRALSRVFGRCLALLLAIPLLYLLGALIGGLIPSNPRWRQPARGITIFVQSNGVHSWISVPTITAGMDWRPLVPARHIREPRYAGDYVAFGYGNRDFYLNTPAWKDLSVLRALQAILGSGPSLVHVYHERKPLPASGQRPIVLTGDQYRRLSAYIASSFDRDRAGRTIPLISRGYGESDVFYEGSGSYNGFYTCNQWTGSALRAAGVRVGLWTPFSESIMARFESAPGRERRN
jgi:uncharacterized protein (TIGR02117 family)